MIDIFLKEDIWNIMKNKNVVFMGDSNIRALYKDFICLLNHSKLITDEILRKKMEPSVFGDKLVYHGAKTNGRDYREERRCTSMNTQVSFFFLTRVYDKYVKDVLNRITSKGKPDVLVINCCLWDVTRWGATGVEDYKINLQTFLKRLKQLLPDCLVIWMTAPPISCELRGGFLVQELEFLRYSLRFHVMEANHFARKVVVENGFDLLDSHYHLKMQIHRRAGDGIHWLPPAVRYVTNLLLTHISLAWNVPLPHRYESTVMEKNLLEDEVSAIVPVKEKEPVQKENNEDFTQPTPKKRKKTLQTKATQQQRLRRIRKWRNEKANHFSPLPSATSSRYNSPMVMSNSSQHDSGYFPSPTVASLSNDHFNHHYNSRNITFGSPAHLQSHGYSSTSNFEPFANWHMPLAYGRHAYQSLLGSYQSYNVQNYSLQYQSTIYAQNVSLLQQPYFPHVLQGQIPRPKTDFTSDDFIAY